MSGFFGGGGGSSTPQGNATAADVLSPATFSSATAGSDITGTMPTQGSTGFTPSGTSSVAIPAGYYDGSGVVAQVAVTAADVLATATIAGVTGTIPSQSATVITPSAATQTAIAAGTYASGAATVSGDTGLVASNIKAGATIFGVAGATNVIDTTTASAATAGDVLTGTDAFANGAAITGTMPNQGSPTLQPGASIPPGYYGGGSVANATIKTQSGTATSASTTSNFTEYGPNALARYALTVTPPAGANNILAVIISSVGGVPFPSELAYDTLVALPTGYADGGTASVLAVETTYYSATQTLLYAFIAGTPLSLTTASIVVPAMKASTVYYYTVLYT